MHKRNHAGGGLPGKDLRDPRSPRYHADLKGVAVRLPKDRIDLALQIVRTRQEHALRDGKTAPVKMSEIIRYAFDLGMYELQIREAISRFTSKHRPFTIAEVADLVRLPEHLLRKEFAARGIQVPNATVPEAHWPMADANLVPIDEEPEPKPAVQIRPAP